jgi:hypothetical protein
VQVFAQRGKCAGVALAGRRTFVQRELPCAKLAGQLTIHNSYFLTNTKCASNAP